MEKSIVYTSMRDENNLSCSYAIIKKEDKAVIIILKEVECIVYDYIDFCKENFNFHYLLLKHYDDENLAYKDFLKLIGKMCKKTIDSKYFSKHIDEDNNILFIDDKNESMLLTDNKYKIRTIELENFIKENKKDFII